MTHGAVYVSSGVVYIKRQRTCQFAEYRKRITVIASSEAIAAVAGSEWADIIVAKAPRRSRVLAIATLIHHRSGKLLRAQ